MVSPPQTEPIGAPALADGPDPLANLWPESCKPLEPREGEPRLPNKEY